MKEIITKLNEQLAALDAKRNELAKANKPTAYLSVAIGGLRTAVKNLEDHDASAAEQAKAEAKAAATAAK